MAGPIPPLKDVLGDHIYASYFFLRMGMALIALALPPGLWLGGKLWMDTDIQNSMSSYYHTEMRDVFVGCLCAVGFYLLLYKGFSPKEDRALDVAGVMAVGIALFPMSDIELRQCAPLCGKECMALSSILDRTFQPLMDSRLHGVFAGAFFLLIAYVCIWCSRDTVRLIRDEKERKLFLGIYKVLGILMIALPGLVLVRWLIGLGPTDLCRNPTVYWAEFVAVWVFGLFWIVKSAELHRSRVEVKYPKRHEAAKAPANPTAEPGK
jgi:hypothetical protein